MRISQDMALSGSGNNNSNNNNNNNRPIPTTLRPDSPPGEESALTDVEDLEQSTTPSLPHHNPITAVLNLPSATTHHHHQGGGGAEDEGGVTDTELLMSENDEDNNPPEEERFPEEASSEQMDIILRDYCAEGEVSIEDHSGDRVTVSRQSISRLLVVNDHGGVEDGGGVTDTEEMEGDDGDDDFEIDIIDTDAPGFSPSAHGGCFFQPAGLDIGRDQVTISSSEKEVGGMSGAERKYSLLEILSEPLPTDPTTDVESLDSQSPRKLSVDFTGGREPSPEFAVDPMTDEESLGGERGGGGGGGYLDPGEKRSITPSDVGDDRLYENVTDVEDEEEGGEGGGGPRLLPGGGLLVEEMDLGALTDCEDLQDSGDEDEMEDPGDDEWKPVRASSTSAELLAHIVEANVAATQTKISMHSGEPEEPFPETPTDDEEIHVKLIDSRTLTPRLVIYNHKDQLAIESDDEGNGGGGGVTDVEDFPTLDGEDPTATDYQPPLASDSDNRIIQEILSGQCSTVSVQESEIGQKIRASCSKIASSGSAVVGNGGKGPETETEELDNIIVKASSGTSTSTTTIPTIVFPEGGVGGNAPPSGCNVVRRRGKKKHARRKRESAQSQLPEDELRSVLKTPPPTSPTSFYETVVAAPNIISVSPSGRVASSITGPPTHHHHDSHHQQQQHYYAPPKSPSVIMDTGEDGKASPIHAEIKLLVRTSENGRESVEIRSLKEVVVPPSPVSPVSPVPPPLSPTSPVSSSPRREALSPTGSSTKTTSEEDSDRVDSPILTQKLVVRFQEGSRDMMMSSDVSASPSRVVDNVGTFTERHQFWKEKDDEERKKRESVTSIEDYTQGFDNSAFAGVETIDTMTRPMEPVTAAAPQVHRTPSPYEIERSKEAIFLDTDDPEQETEVQLEDLVQYQVKQVGHVSPSERKVLFQGVSSSTTTSTTERSISVDSEQQLKEQISREIFESELAEKIEGLEPETKSLIQEAYEIRDDSPSGDDKSETETTEKLRSTEERMEDVRFVASSLVSEIESTVGRKFEGVVEQPKRSAPSSVDITDEELMSTGDISSPEPQRSFKYEGTERHESTTELPTAGSSVGGTETGTPDTHAVRSSSSGEFFTAHEDSTIKSSSDEPSRPKSWDSSILGQVSNNFPASHSGGSEYQTALGATSHVSSSESYLGSLSSDASASGTLVASQIDLGAELLADDDEEEDSFHAQVRTQVSVEGSVTTDQSGTVTTRSIYCEAGSSQGIPPPGTGLPVTLTSSTSGTTVCTQVETTYEASVKGDPQLDDDQDGNMMDLESSLREVMMVEPPQRMIRTHRRSESQSWGDSPIRYGIEERIEEEQLKDIVFQGEEEEMTDLFEPNEDDDMDDPIQRPITPEPQFSPDDQPRRVYYPDSSFEQSVDSLLEQDEEPVEKRGGGGGGSGGGGMPEFTMEYERVIAPQHRLEDIEEESSVKNSPKSVMSLEMSSSLPELEERNGNGNGEKSGGRPGSRESSSSLREFERLECAVLAEVVDLVRKEEPTLSEIEEGHESQVSEMSEATEICEEHDSGELEFDDKNKMSMSSQPYETADDDASQLTDIADLALDVDPMMTFFSTTVIEPQTPDTTETSQLDDFQLRSEMVGTTDADSSLEFRAPGSKTTTTSDAKMTSSGDSLDDQSGSKNLMEVSRDSLDFEQEGQQQQQRSSSLPATELPPEMVGSADSLTGVRRTTTTTTTTTTQQPSDFDLFEPDPLISTRPDKEPGMSDSLELQPGTSFPQTMTESADSLNESRSATEDRSFAGAAGGIMLTSSDSLEGQAIDPSASSNTSTTGDAAMWSSIGGGSASTLVSSQEDLTLENQ